MSSYHSVHHPYKKAKKKQDSFYEEKPSFWTIFLYGISGF
jgi:fatty-acid desaturase